jgi:plasmid stabilization system protein ParE
MATDRNENAVAAETPTRGEVVEAERQPDLVWDKEALGLCVRVHGNGAQSFLFIYRMNDRQRFLRIGKSPKWSLEAARKRAKELGAVIDQGGDPEIYNRERHKIGPVENLIRYISRELGTNP